MEILERDKIFETIFYQSTDGILIIEDGRFIECNDASVKMLKYKSKEEFLSSLPSDISPEYQPDGKSSFEKVEENRKIVLETGSRSFEWVHTKATGEDFWVEVVLTDISPTKEKILFLVVWRDIDEKKKNEQELKDLNAHLAEKVAEEVERNRQKDLQLLNLTHKAQMGEMIENIAHQWKQPLSNIGTVVTTLDVKHSLGTLVDKDLEESIENISEYTTHLANTIDVFRNYMQQTKTHINVILQKNIESTLHIMEPMFRDNFIRLINEVNHTNPIHIKMAAGELSQVIINIINNAKDILKEKKIQDPWVKIGLNEHRHNVLITIEDNAGGIPKNIISKIFDPYFTTKVDNLGTGLGLNMSSKIISESFKGKLYVKNTDNGAKFFIDIPL